MNKTFLALSNLEGSIVCLTNDYEALRAQVGWTYFKLDDCFDEKDCVDLERMSAYSHEIKIELTNIVNLHVYFKTQLKDLENEVNALKESVAENK